MTNTAELDTSRRYLVPVARVDLPDEPNLVHLSVYQWLPRRDAWATGPALCGYSTRQGPLPDGTAVTCRDCLEYRPRYERMLAPGYRPEDDAPEVLRERLAAAEVEIAELKRERDVLRKSTARLADIVANVAAFAFGHRDSRSKWLRVKWLTADRVLAYVSGPERGCDCERTMMRRNRHAGHLVTCPLRGYRTRHYGSAVER